MILASVSESMPHLSATCRTPPIRLTCRYFANLDGTRPVCGKASAGAQSAHVLPALCNHGGELREKGKIPAIQRQILYEGLVHQSADGCIPSIQQRRASLDGDAIQDGTYRHFEIDRQRILDVQDHVRPDELLESGLFHFDAARSRRQIRERVFARAVGRRFIAEIRAGVDRSDLRIRNGRLRRIGHPPGDGGICGLRPQRARIQRQKQNQQNSGFYGCESFVLGSRLLVPTSA